MCLPSNTYAYSRSLSLSLSLCRCTHTTHTHTHIYIYIYIYILIYCIYIYIHMYIQYIWMHSDQRSWYHSYLFFSIVIGKCASGTSMQSSVSTAWRKTWPLTTTGEYAPWYCEISVSILVSGGKSLNKSWFSIWSHRISIPWLTKLGPHPSEDISPFKSSGGFGNHRRMTCLQVL